VRDVYGVLVALLMSFGLAYFFLAMGIGTWAERRISSGGEIRPSKRPRGKTPEAVFVLVPCRDEEEVIGATISAVLGQDPSASIVVIDDGSTDATAAIVAQAMETANGRVRLVRRVLPNARKGKGPALNAGFQEVLDAVRARELDPKNVVICVMDADGRLSEGAIPAVLPAFEDRAVGGVQLPVSIRNQNTLVEKMVHFEFWGYSAISQFGRNVSRTVSLGGNGQFTRLEALLELGEQPWSTSLTEDLDLSVSLAIRGWEMRMVPGASVNQQAVSTVTKYVKQRARWFQGHMTTSLRIPEVWRSKKISNAAMLELVTYLVLPFALVLPWSILGQIAIFDFVRWLSLPSFRSAGGGVRIGLFAFAYVMSFLPNLVLGYLYYRRDEKVSVLRALGMAHMMLLFNYLSYIAAWMAFIRLLRGKNTWDKTTRTSEAPISHQQHTVTTASVGATTA
jgi:1,2-diacylglycerol 3-beta-glucosyltransferase